MSEALRSGQILEAEKELLRPVFRIRSAKRKVDERR
jgi:hypothetical protein